MPCRRLVTTTIPFLGQLDLLQTCLGIFLMDSNQVIRIEVGCSLTMCSGTGGMLEDLTIIELKICLSKDIALYVHSLSQQILSGILWRKNKGCYGNFHSLSYLTSTLVIASEQIPRSIRLVKQVGDN